MILASMLQPLQPFPRYARRRMAGYERRERFAGRCLRSCTRSGQNLLNPRRSQSAAEAAPHFASARQASWYKGFSQLFRRMKPIASELPCQRLFGQPCRQRPVVPHSFCQTSRHRTACQPAHRLVALANEASFRRC